MKKVIEKMKHIEQIIREDIKAETEQEWLGNTYPPEVEPEGTETDEYGRKGVKPTLVENDVLHFWNKPQHDVIVFASNAYTADEQETINKLVAAGVPLEWVIQNFTQARRIEHIYKMQERRSRKRWMSLASKRNTPNKEEDCS
jgi:hypothetical protein